MDKELKLLLDNSKLDQLYKNNLFSIKSICELLGIWDQYSSEEKFKLENFSKRDSNINKHFTYNGTYELKYTYGEVIRKGVDTIIEKINKYKKPTDKDVFVDIGCGAGKLVLHIAIKTDIKTLLTYYVKNEDGTFSDKETKNIVNLGPMSGYYKIKIESILFGSKQEGQPENVLSQLESIKNEIINGTFGEFFGDYETITMTKQKFDYYTNKKCDVMNPKSPGCKV